MSKTQVVNNKIIIIIQKKFLKLIKIILETGKINQSIILLIKTTSNNIIIK
jgi:hypothetical protein